MPTADLDRAWNAIVADARQRIGDPAWDTWLSVLRPVAAEAHQLHVRAPEHARSWIADRLLPMLSASASRVLDRPLEVVLAAPPAAPAGPPGRGGQRRGEQPAPPPPPAERPLTPRYRFEEFVLGPANRFAHAAALTVAENPGIAYNPLFLCGPPGVGKTHLLHAVGHYARRHHPGLRARYCTAETFTNEFTDALRRHGIDAFKERYRSIDLLLVDDVQFLMAKKATEEEFFHTFNALHEAGAQLVLTADRVPDDLDRMEQRLRDRFAAGLVAEVEPPDLATRLMILRKRVTGQAVELAEPGALEEIARHVSSSVRAVEAALVRVVAFASLTDRPLTRGLAQEVLDSLYPGRDHSPGQRRIDQPATTGEVLRATALTFEISEDDLLSRRSDKRLAWARKLAMYVAREETGDSYPNLGRAFGGRNHTTVMNAVRGVSAQIERDPSAQVDLARVRARLAAVHGTASADGADAIRAQDDRRG
ncbi:chromosomal replication initiator protein DnaA [Patulibacter defluvii]|uniref:chromosomal replication initiator protein DnaA n=1 Tax=Patulibacter defluvii TaxID=3095358 RepID=UPI002A75EF90|nr:chromosomal replication initiator protein DnaA [Patulibacter sp. DM4]